MAIQFVGQASFATPATSFSLTSLTGGLASAPAEGDLVVLLAFAPLNAAARPTVSTGGYTTVTAPAAPGLIQPNTVLAYKVMGASPDSSVAVSASSAARVMVFRGVDTSTPLDVAAITGSGAGPSVVLGAITPSTTGAWVVPAGVITAGATSTNVAITAPTDLDVFASAAMTSGTYRGSGGLGYYDGWTSGAFDPANWTSDASGSFDQYEAYTLALRPGDQKLLPSLITNSPTFFATTVTASYALAPPLLANSQTFHAATVSRGPVSLVPALLTNAQEFFEPTVEQFGVLLAPLFINSQSFYPATVSAGPVSLAAPLLTNAQAFPVATVSPGPVALAPPLLANAQEFFAPGVLRIVVAVTPAERVVIFPASRAANRVVSLT